MPQDALRQHARDLADEVVVEAESDNGAGGSSTDDDEIIEGSLHGTQAADISLTAIKTLIPAHRHPMNILWDEAGEQHMNTPEDVERDRVRVRESWETNPSYC